MSMAKPYQELRRLTNDLFTAAVRDLVPRLRYVPAEIGGRKVPTVGAEDVRFRAAMKPPVAVRCMRIGA
jgi:hypothetical protein